MEKHSENEEEEGTGTFPSFPLVRLLVLPLSVRMEGEALSGSFTLCFSV